jgi:hypothetical protein
MSMSEEGNIRDLSKYMPGSFIASYCHGEIDLKYFFSMCGYSPARSDASDRRFKTGGPKQYLRWTYLL